MGVPLRVPRHLLTGALAMAVFYGLLGVEVQCTPAEARPSLGDLQEQVDALRSQLDELPVLVDGNGTIVGAVVGVSGNSLGPDAVVQIDLDGLPLFQIHVTKDQINSGQRSIWFESDNCTGELLTSAGTSTRANAVWGAATVHPSEGPDRLFYVTDASAGSRFAFVSSQLGDSSTCVPGGTHSDDWFVATPVDLDSMLTPPFQVVTRGELGTL